MNKTENHTLAIGLYQVCNYICLLNFSSMATAFYLVSMNNAGVKF